MKMGSRWCILAGTLVLTLGLLLAIPAFSIFYMAITLGGLVGTLYTVTYLIIFLGGGLYESISTAFLWL